MAAGFGGGAGLFIPFIAVDAAERRISRDVLWTGVFQGLVILIVAQFLRHPPADRRAPAAAQPAPPAAQLGKQHFTTGEMLRTPQFYDDVRRRSS